MLVSGTGNRTASPPSRIVDAVFDMSFAVLASVALQREYERVFWRPGIQRQHGLAASEIRAYLGHLASISTLREPPRAAESCPDPDDQHLWDLLAAEPEAILVTGERELRKSQDFPGRVLSPREFVERHLAASP